MNRYVVLIISCCCVFNMHCGNPKSINEPVLNAVVKPGELSQKEIDYYAYTLGNFFNDHLLKGSFNGEILVAKKGTVVYEKYVGFADLRKKDLPEGQAGLITSTTPMHIASTSKTFTAVALLQMVQENKLSLDDSLNQFFPGFPYPGITVKMLLNHRSGLPNYIYFVSNSKWDQNNTVTNKDVLDILYNEKPNKSFTAGTRFSYSNTNYVLLALIIEKLSGQPFPQYMKQKIFDPLHMDHTFVFTPDDSLIATPSFNYDGRYWQNDFLEGTYGDKNVYSTSRDLLKWDQALYTEKIINRSLLDAAFKPYSNERPSLHNYGLGWRLLDYPNGKKIIYHFGRWHGFNAAFARLIEDSATIIILGNRFNRNIYNTAHEAYNIFGEYSRNNESDEETDSTLPEEIKSLPPKNKKK